MLTKDKYESIFKNILLKLNGLPKILSYHGLHHTLDVLAQAERISAEENITDETKLYLIRIACLYHDSGFLMTEKGHETAGCRLVREDLPRFGINEKEIDTICGLIMATKIPQSPANLMEEITCDADLDYLGRSDFFEISYTLYLEMKERGLVADEKAWDQIQVRFLKQHHYFTFSNKKLREKQKQRHLEEIEARLKK